MKLKSFKAPTVARAMELVRTELGSDAIILSTRQSSRGAEIMAAVEPTAAAPEPALDFLDTDLWSGEAAPPIQVNGASLSHAGEPEPSIPPFAEPLIDAMTYHGVPLRLSERICRTALDTGLDDPVTALGAALDQHFGFSSVIRGIRRPVMLVGPAGAGKTLTAAKILSRTVLDDAPIEAATTDHKRAGGIEQLKAFTDILSLPLGVARGREDIMRISARARQAGRPLVIDSAGINPYDDGDLSELAGFIVAAEAEPVLVLPVGTDPAEAGDWAEIFAKLGCRRLIVTRLDSARRFGAMLAAASAGELRFAHATTAPSAAEGLADVTPMGLARLILNDPDLLETRSGMEEQAQ